MSVYPRDVVLTKKGVIYVHPTKVERNLDGGFITVSGLNGDGEMCKDVPVSNPIRTCCWLTHQRWMRRSCLIGSAA